MSRSPSRFNVSSVCFSRDTTHFNSENDYCKGCRNVSYCQQQQSYSGLRSPGHSYSTNLLSVVFTFYVEGEIYKTQYASDTKSLLTRCLAGKNNLSYFIIVRTVPDPDLDISGGGGLSSKKCTCNHVIITLFGQCLVGFVDLGLFCALDVLMLD